MRAIIKEKDRLIEYASPKSHIVTSSFQELERFLLPGKTWVGFITYEGEAHFFEPGSIQIFDSFSDFSTPSLSLVKPFDTLETYVKKIEIIQDEIRKGNVYQVNLSHESIWEGDLDSLALFKKLSHNPFSAYFEWDDLKIISGSPEKLLSREGNILETCPIKGSAPIGQKEWLLNSFKDQAELNMITDLVRSDLAWISETGSTKVISPLNLTSYPHIHHLHSIVQSRSMIHPIRCIESLFPGGSITGCPKLSAMNVIHALEKRKRGIYTGSIGVIKPNSDFCFNIAIRTLTYQRRKLYLSLGGGITIDSDPPMEYEETLTKGREMFGLILGNREYRPHQPTHKIVSPGLYTPKKRPEADKDCPEFLSV